MQLHIRCCQATLQDMECPKYFWRLFQASWAFARLPFDIDKWVTFLPQGWRVSFGFWLRFTVDEGATARWREKNHPHINYDETISRGEIRVLKLLPGSRDRPLRTELIFCRLADMPDYEALSYVWGDIYPGEDIWVGDQEVNIGSSLASALRTYRRLDQPRYIWVDRLCINQRYLEEVRDQIRQMSDIYRMANNVLVWLGEADETSVYGIDAIKYFIDPSAVAAEAPWLSNETDPYADGLGSIMKREWWTRIWTIQEAALARQVTLTCGGYQICWKTDLDTLRRAKFKLKFASTSPQWEDSNFQLIDLLPLVEVIESQLREVMEVSNLRLEKDLLDIVYDFRHRKATVEADKVYAMLNLAEGRRIDIKMNVGDAYVASRDQARDVLARAVKQLYPDMQIAVGL